jgi:hypothetical protein
VDEWPRGRSSEQFLKLLLMKVGIICEGHTDRPVIMNLLKGISNIEYSDIVPLRPEVNYDETHLSHLDPNSFGSWTNVMNECINRKKIEQFLSIEGQDWIVIQIDSLQCDDYDVNRPHRNSNDYPVNFRNQIIQKINEWLENNFLDNVIYAISIEEIESWLLTIHVNSNSTSSTDPKSKLKLVLRKKGLSSEESYRNYFQLSEPFSKKRNHERYRYVTRNESLSLFCQELEGKIAPNQEQN